MTVEFTVEYHSHEPDPDPQHWIIAALVRWWRRLNNHPAN